MKTINNILEEIKVKSDPINDSLWYVNPKDIKQSLTELLEEIRLEEMEQAKEEGDADWFYGYGYNQAKQDLDNKIDKLKGI